MLSSGNPEWVVNDAGSRVVFTNSAATSLSENMRAINAPALVFVLCGESERSQKLAVSVVADLKENHTVTIIAKCGNQVDPAVVGDVKSMLPEDESSSSFMLLSVGGGGAVGMAKAVSLQFTAGVRIACVPTTYAGSEMTNISGITTTEGKKTVRDDRARPVLCIYDHNLVASMPRPLALKSSFNAVAHAVEALWDVSASPTGMIMAEEAVKTIMKGLNMVMSGEEEYNSSIVCYTLLYGAYLCGSVLNTSKMGIHHKLAHIVGGSFGVAHDTAHTVLLPHSIFFNKDHAPVAAAEALKRTIGGGSSLGAVSSKLWDVMKQLDVPISLRVGGFKSTDIEKAAELAFKQAAVGSYVNPRPIDSLEALKMLFHCAYHGRRPSLRTAFSLAPLSKFVFSSYTSSSCSSSSSSAPVSIRTGTSHANQPVSIGGAPLEKADVAVICVHGRFSSADRILQQFEDIVGNQYEGGRVALVAPQALDSSWYPSSFLLPIAENEPNFSLTMSVIDSCVKYVKQFVPTSRIVLFGFSQGACSILSYACNKKATCNNTMVGVIIALSGGLCGAETEQAWLYESDTTAADTSSSPSSLPLAGCKVILGCAEQDAHVPQARVEATASLLVREGAAVTCEIFPGKEHKIFPSSASRTRALFSELVASAVGASAHDKYEYLGGYQSLLESEALPGTIPTNQRSPAVVAHGLIAEVITGSPFVAPRATSLSTWFYRIHPSIGTHGEFKPLHHPTLRGDFCCPSSAATPEPVRWNPPPHPQHLPEAKDWVEGLVTIAGTGSPFSVKGMAIHRYSCNKDMVDRSFYNSDGDLLIVPELGPLNIQTEFGFLRLAPGEIFVLPRGLKMTVTLPSGFARGFVSELFEHSHFQLPNLGPIGTNGLADARHFKVPVAQYEDRACKDYELVSKFGGKLFIAPLQYSPYDVVGWSGRYHPCKYDLMNFMALGSVTHDHPDPSLHTVLGCTIDTATGASACDFVCFRSRYDAVKHTFRPPWYHRNIATEFNAIIEISSPYSGFDKGVHWLTPCVSGHGIAGASYNGYMSAPPNDTAMVISEGSLWIMFESIYPLALTDLSMQADFRDVAYRDFFSGIPRTFTGPASASAIRKRKTVVTAARSEEDDDLLEGGEDKKN